MLQQKMVVRSRRPDYEGLFERVIFYYEIVVTEISFINSITSIDDYGLGPLPAPWTVTHKNKTQFLPSTAPGRGDSRHTGR